MAELKPPLKIAWISSFPMEWLPDPPSLLRKTMRLHPAPWQRVLLREFKKDTRFRFFVFAVRGQFERTLSFEKEGVSFYCLRAPPGLRRLSVYWYDTVAIGRWLRRIGPDLVHAWGSEGGAPLVASRLGFPYLVTMHGLLRWCSEQVRLSPYQRFDALLEGPALRRASIVTAESAFAVRWLRERYPHLEVLQAEHAPDWLFQSLERKPQTAPVRFLFVGLVSLLKGSDLLLTALDKMRSEIDFRLTVVGSAAPGILQRLKSSVSPVLWQQIEFRQNLATREIAAELARTTILLFPTRADNSPNSVKEAVISGVPVVASAVGGIIDYVKPGLNGLTFPVGNLDEFIKAIRAAIAHPLFRRGRVDPKTLQFVRNHLSPKLMADSFSAAYRRVLQQS